MHPKPMTYPRSHLVDPDGGVYHVCSRCVRRAFLCGFDSITGAEYEHRRAWLEERMLQLADIFAIDLFGYAVMSNHYHMVIQLVPERTDTWSDDTIAEKWLALFPRQAESQVAEQAKQADKHEILSTPERIAVLRERLKSLSWFMRCLNEPLARLANQEDCCKGRFWEGRFKSQRLLDETAVLAAMVYVDLNPVRAGIATGVEDSHYTSIHRRKRTQNGAERLTSLCAVREPLPVSCSMDEYEELLIWTALAQQSKRPISRSAQRTLAQCNAPNSTIWLEHYLPKPNYWQRAIGSVQSLKDYAKDLNQCWIKTRSMHLQY
jgi:REP element-mobilizing transposase RayT